ncbi:MAG: ABC transporter permease subunit [Clostridia bacterium]|nr:ABC transporter permease subunit [Clostridia bacterium]
MVVVSAVLLILLAAAVAANLFAAGQTNIFWKTGYGGDIQNSRIYVDEETGNTFLGTYSNSIMAFDGDGNPIWNQEISGAIESMTFDSERDWLIVGSQDRNVYIYQAGDGENIRTYALKGRVYDMDYDQAGGRLLVSSGVSKTKHEFLVLDIETGEELNKISTKKISRAAKFTSDKQHIIYGTNQGRVVLSDLEGEKIAEQKVKGEVRSLAVVESTGEVISMDKSGFLYKFDAQLNELYSLELVGEGRCVGASDDGKWIAAGTREGDIHILNAEGVSQFSTRQEYDVSQIYFGEKTSYVVTLSRDLYGFDAGRLETIGLMDSIRSYSVGAIAVLAVGLAAALIAALPYSRWLAVRFFRSAYRHRVAYLMLAPSIILILVFQYYNVFQAFWYAFTDWSLATKTMREVKFVGLDNFVKMFTEGYFLLGTKNLIIMIVCSFIKLLTVPLLLAEVVFAMKTKTGESSRRRYWFRLLLVVPMVVPGVVSTLMWKNIYDPNIGALNSFLDAVGLPGWKHSWLGDESTALWSIIFMGFPFVNSFAFLVYYGGLINIPTELFEAARVDGSNPLWNFTHIHMPLISPQLKMLIVTTFISSVQDYGGVYLLTGGGPGTATYVPGLELYYAATKFGQYGYACAMGLVMFIVILIGSLINMRMKTQELG